jgi:hypothetical protein
MIPPNTSTTDRQSGEPAWEVARLFPAQGTWSDSDYLAADYAAAGIPEYWIVDPQTQDILVLTLPAGADQYAEHGRFARGQRATSKRFDGSGVAVADAFDAAYVWRRRRVLPQLAGLDGSDHGRAFGS